MDNQLPKGVTRREGETTAAVLYPSKLWTAGLYIWTLGLWEVWRRRHFIALTSERLIFGKGIVLRKTLRSIPLEWVQDVTYQRTLWMGGIQVSSAGGALGLISDVLYRPRDAKRMAELVTEGRRRPAHDPSGAPA